MAKPSSIIVILLFIIFLLATAPSSYSNNQTDFEALLAFKKAIQDDPLGSLSSWNETTDFCRWNGVWCSKRHQNRVVSVSLPSQGLLGTLSPHIANLSFLKYVNLQNNTLHGLIPQEMGRLRRLEFLEFSNNSLVGGIPRNLTQCSNLYHLSLMDNQLTGSIVPEIGSLVNLEHLGLSRNRLLGTIPPSLGNISSLIQLELERCGLQGDIPDSLVQLGRLQLLNFYQNSLTGWIPFGLFNLSSIEYLGLGDNRFHGTIPNPSTVFTLAKLRFLGLGYNHFTGPLPAWLSNSSLIEIIRVSSNNFTGEMIDVTRLPALQFLVAEFNHLEGDVDFILSSLANCTGLQTIAFDDNLFSGSLPDSIGNLSSDLWGLRIGDNQLSGSIPSSIGNLSGLTYLSFAYNDLQGHIPSSIGQLAKLQEIYLGSNMLTNEIPLSFGNLTLLNRLVLWRNNLSGNIPPSLGNCRNLLELDLSRNNLNGSIPTEIMRLSSISILLDLSFNILIGSIPPEVGTLRNLDFLDLSHNRLSGFLPSTLSSCETLQWLLLGSNSLQGEIPDSLSALRGLQDLDLSRNNFSGTIPRFLGELRLLNLNLSFNALHGEVPTLGVFQNGSAFSHEGNLELCGGVAILNLPSCSSTDSKDKNLVKILIPTAAAICLALSVCFCVIIYRRRTSQNPQTSAAVFGVPEFLRLSYGDLLNATGGFSEMNLVGAGRFGSVYKGSIIINDNKQTDVAVKVLNLNERGASKSLASECNALRGIRHRNLLKILSVCDSIDFKGEEFKALVYDFKANRSLENWLHQNSDEEVVILSTIQRLNIAIDIAYGVEYLHFSTNSSIVHGDLKPSNILLDHDMVAHVSDFGLAKIISSISGNLSSSDGSSSTSIKGTIGYIAPEYGMNNAVSTQGDAYSYGVLLLEMFTNRRPTSDALEGHINLHEFVSSALPDCVMEVVDPFLHQELSRNDKYRACIVSILSIGVRCSKQLPRDRMSMEVVLELRRVRNLFLAARN